MVYGMYRSGEPKTSPTSKVVFEKTQSSAQRRAGDEDEECGTSGGEILSPELEDFLRSSVAARERAGDGNEEGGKDEDGTGKRKCAASGEEREGETGERAGKKKKRSGGSQRREWARWEVRRKHHAELCRYRVKPCAAQGGVADERL